MEKNSNGKRSKLFIYRISLVLAAVCVCTAVVAINGMRTKKITENIDIPVTPPAQTKSEPVSSPKTDVPKQTAVPKTQSATSEEKPAVPVQSTPAAAEKKPAFSIDEVELLRPADGKVVFAHSGDKLVYHKLYDDWRVHSGVDLVANPSSQVKAAYDGTVAEVKPDGNGKFVITLDHKYFKTVYSGVSTDKLAEKGKTVKKGDVISGMPDKNTLYDMPHMTFEVIYVGNSIDPEPLFK